MTNQQQKFVLVDGYYVPLEKIPTPGLKRRSLALWLLYALAIAAVCKTLL